MKDIKDITNILKKISKRKKINTKKNLFAQGLELFGCNNISFSR